MKKKISIVCAIVLLVAAVYSCKKNTDNPSGSGSVSLDLPATPFQYYTFGKADSINKVATLGRVLFYDSHLSVNNAISCGSCHKQALGFADNAAFSTGFEGKLTKRNSPGFNSLSLAGSLFWDGRENNIMNLSIRPITNHVEMGIDDPNTLPAKLSSLPYYSNLFKDAFGDKNITSDRISGAIGVFLRSISALNSRFDYYQNGDSSALTALELEGKTLFDTKYNCGRCHTGGGGYYGTGTFKDIGLDNNYTDPGRGTVTGRSTDNGTFRIPNLKNVALTAPYMHDGRYKTLGDVIDHYSKDIRSSPNLDIVLTDSAGHARMMNISDHEKEALIAFLNTLTDYQLITDQKFSNPFKVN
jgi:cytochrome c peroxidase